MTHTRNPDFLGSYPCAVCGRRVRIYGWLPTCVLCAQCTRETARSEATAEDHEDHEAHERETT